jgi:thiamine-phosphate pyrophosphorylase
MHGLYAIVDTKLLETRGIDPLAYVRALLEAKPAALQIRAKDMSARELLGLLRAVRPLCRQAGVPLIANDRADLAALAGCETVHIGQEDLPYELVHRIAPQLTVGISTHDRAQLDRALCVRPRYVAYGPVYPIPAKLSHDPVVGVEGLRQAAAVARAAGVPIVAAGGITLARVAEVAPHADACAVVADLVPEGATLGEVTERGRAFQSAFEAARGGVEIAP